MKVTRSGREAGRTKRGKKGMECEDGEEEDANADG
jgi:hypothetical protein